MLRSNFAGGAEKENADFGEDLSHQEKEVGLGTIKKRLDYRESRSTIMQNGAHLKQRISFSI
jgi:hypothetical protein